VIFAGFVRRQAAGRKTPRLGRKKFSLGCGAKGNFLSPRLSNFFQKWNLYFCVV